MNIMTDYRGLGGAAFLSLALSATFWFWFADGLLNQHAPSTTYIAGGIILVGLSTLATAFVAAVRGLRSAALRADLLAGLSILAMASFVGTMIVLEPVLVGPASLTQQGRLSFALGLGGSLGAAVFCTVLSRRLVGFRREIDAETASSAT